jgi:hypothetical protein
MSCLHARTQQLIMTTFFMAQQHAFQHLTCCGFPCSHAQVRPVLLCTAQLFGLSTNVGDIAATTSAHLLPTQHFILLVQGLVQYFKAQNALQQVEQAAAAAAAPARVSAPPQHHSEHPGAVAAAADTVVRLLQSCFAVQSKLEAQVLQKVSRCGAASSLQRQGSSSSHAACTSLGTKRHCTPEVACTFYTCTSQQLSAMHS